MNGIFELWMGTRLGGSRAGWPNAANSAVEVFGGAMAVASRCCSTWR